MIVLSDHLTVCLSLVDWLPIIAGVSALLLVICAVVGVFVYYTYYKKTKMGQYQVRLLGVAK